LADDVTGKAISIRNIEHTIHFNHIRSSPLNQQNKSKSSKNSGNGKNDLSALADCFNVISRKQYFHHRRQLIPFIPVFPE